MPSPLASNSEPTWAKLSHCEEYCRHSSTASSQTTSVSSGCSPASGRLKFDRPLRSVEKCRGGKRRGFRSRPPGRSSGRDRQNRRPSRTSRAARSEEHTSELQSLMRISYAVFCLKNKNNRRKQKQK